MKKRRLGEVAVIVVALAFLALMFLPDRETTLSYCPYCRAEKRDTRSYWFWHASSVTENPLTVYWRADVEPGHIHTWKSYSRSFVHGVNRGIACGYKDPRTLQLPVEAEIAMLKSFATPAERRAFVGDRLVSGPWKEQSPRQITDFGRLAEAYKQNPDRKDWQQVLKELGVIR